MLHRLRLPDKGPGPGIITHCHSERQYLSFRAAVPVIPSGSTCHSEQLRGIWCRKPEWHSRSFTPPPDPSLRLRLQILHSASGSVQDDKWGASFRMTRNVIPSSCEESGGEGWDNGPRTSQIRILLKTKLLQNIIVRGPCFFGGITTRLFCIVLYLNELRKVDVRGPFTEERLCARGINPSATTKLKTHTFPDGYRTDSSLRSE